MKIVEWILGPIMRILFRFDSVGVDNLPSGPFILASNHVSYMDPIMIQAVTIRRHKPGIFPKYLSKSELFNKKFMRWFMSNAGQIPVDRDSSHARDSLRHARAALEAGDVVGIFPEGTISLTLVPMSAHSGVGRLAVDTKVPVVPAAVWGTHRSWPKYHKRNFGFRRPIVIEFGEPKTYVGSDPVEASNDIMRQIVELVDDARSRYPTDAHGAWWGPPDWPIERGGKWRVHVDHGTDPEVALDMARDAMYSEAG